MASSARLYMASYLPSLIPTLAWLSVGALDSTTSMLEASRLEMLVLSVTLATSLSSRLSMSVTAMATVTTILASKTGMRLLSGSTDFSEKEDRLPKPPCTFTETRVASPSGATAMVSILVLLGPVRVVSTPAISLNLM